MEHNNKRIENYSIQYNGPHTIATTNGDASNYTIRNIPIGDEKRDASQQKYDCGKVEPIKE